MKTYLNIILFLSITQFVVKGQIPSQLEQRFLISGVLSSDHDSLTLYLVKRANSMHPDQPLEIIDSCWIVNDSFMLIGFVPEPDYYSLLTKVGIGWLPFILENETYFIKGNVNNIWWSEISASSNTVSESKLYSKIVNPLIYELNDMSDSTQKYSFLGEKEKASVYSQINKKLSDHISEITFDFIKNNPHSYHSLFLFKSLFRKYSIDTLRVLFKDLDIKLKEHSQGLRISDLLVNPSLETIVGSKFEDFSFQMDSNKNISTDDINKRYLLLDFWASWCAPCRQKHPQMIDLYNEQRNKVEIISISLDNNKLNWKKAIDMDNLNWINILDKEQPKSLSLKYNITSIPANFLIDKRSNLIISKNVDISDINSYIKNN